MWVDPWLIAGLTLLVAGAAPLAPGALLVGLLGLAWLLRPAALGGRWLPVCAVLVVVGAARAAHALERFEQTRVSVRDQLGEPSRCAGHGVVSESPVWVRGALRSLVRFDRLDCEGRQVRGPLLVRLYGGPPRLTRNARLFVVAKLGAVRSFRNAASTDPLPFAARSGAVLSGSALSVELTAPGSGVRALVDRARNRVRQRILASFAPAAEPMARALVLGENDLASEDDQAFKKSGLSHLLAVSGTHLVFAVVTLVTALRALLLRWEWLARRTHVTPIASGVGMLLALVYADFSGGSGSAWRAAWMLVFVFGARMAERRPDPARVLALTLFAGALLDPLVLFDVSFMLSLAATAGLLVIARPLVVRCQRLRWAPLRYVCISLAATIASMIPCTPLLASISPELTLAGLFANVVAAPIGELAALPICLTHALTEPLPALESGLALVGSGALLLVRQVALASASIDSLAFPIVDPKPWQFAVLGFGASGLLLDRLHVPASRSRTACWVFGLSLGLIVIELAERRAARHAGLLKVSALDVGQGDATLVGLPDGGSMLIDGGGFVGSPVDPGERVILPWLRAERREELSLVVLSHPHPDHFGGLLSVVRNVRVGEFWDTGQGQREGAGPNYRALFEALRQRQVPILGPADLCGQARDIGGARLEVLGPCPGYRPGRDANDNSLVVKLSYGARSFLFTGDAEAEQESELLRQHPGRLRSDVLKVGHHGSRTSSGAALLEAARPRFATISCGVRNRFGHPHPETLAALATRQVVTMRTDRAGSVSFVTDGQRLDLYAATLPR